MFSLVREFKRSELIVGVLTNFWRVLELKKNVLLNVMVRVEDRYILNTIVKLGNKTQQVLQFT